MSLKQWFNEIKFTQLNIKNDVINIFLRQNLTKLNSLNTAKQ